jgi:hypothetical protein
MTSTWFVVWLPANDIGGHEPFLFNPVNAWTATLIFAVDLTSAYLAAPRIG